VEALLKCVPPIEGVKYYKYFELCHFWYIRYQMFSCVWHILGRFHPFIGHEGP